MKTFEEGKRVLHDNGNNEERMEGVIYKSSPFPEITGFTVKWDDGKYAIYTTDMFNREFGLTVID